MVIKYITQRTIQGVLILFCISILSFTIMNFAPGDPAVAVFGGQADKIKETDRIRISHNLGLDKPLHERYINWVNEVSKGNLGISFIEGVEVKHILKDKISNSLYLFIFTFLIILILSIIFGVLAGFYENSIWDTGLTYLSIIFHCTPSFWVAIIGIYIFSYKLGMLPSSGSEDLFSNGNFSQRIKHLILPSMTIIITHTGPFARFIQERIKEEKDSYYVLVARTNKVKEKYIIKGILKNALIPFVNYLGMHIPSFIGSFVIIETVFAYSGIGKISTEAIFTKDYPLLMGSVLVTGIIVIVSMLVVDCISFALNPKLRKEMSRG